MTLIASAVTLTDLPLTFKQLTKASIKKHKKNSGNTKTNLTFKKIAALKLLAR